MDTEPNNANADPNTADDLRSVIRGVIDEYVSTEHRRAEPVYKTELADERRRREQLLSTADVADGLANHEHEWRSGAIDDARRTRRQWQCGPANRL